MTTQLKVLNKAVVFIWDLDSQAKAQNANQIQKFPKLHSLRSLPFIFEITFKFEPKSQPYSILFFDPHFCSPDVVPMLGQFGVQFWVNFGLHFGSQIGLKTGPKNQDVWVNFWNPF